MPRQTYKNRIQKDTNSFLDATLLLSVLFDDDDNADHNRRNIGEIGIIQCNEEEMVEEDIYEVCEALAVALPHIRYLAPRVPLMRGHDFGERVSQYSIL